MQNTTTNDLSDEIISTITPPQGWEIIDETEAVMVNDPQDVYGIKKAVSEHLAFITERTEYFIDYAFRNYNIVIYEAYIFIDADAAFHIILLVSTDDYLSPHMIAAKIKANEVLTTTEDVDMRFKFTVADEYIRFHNTNHNYKLKYVYKNATLTYKKGDEKVVANHKDFPFWAHNHHPVSPYW